MLKHVYCIKSEKNLTLEFSLYPQSFAINTSTILELCDVNTHWVSTIIEFQTIIL